MHSSERLEKALREAGLEDMAKKARDHHYHDFLSPLDLPILELLTDLAKEKERHPEMAEIIAGLERQVRIGVFDATKQESDDWANSPDGIKAFKKFFER